jgi:serine/threonine-protein kinase
MSPEQADHRIGNADERSDIYTLAVILYEAVAGRRPFESESFAGLLMKVAHEDPTPLDEVVADVPDEFAAVVMWGLHRDPALRPTSVADFAVALEGCGSVPFATEGHALDARVAEVRESMRAPSAAGTARAAGIANTAGTARTAGTSSASDRAPAKLSERAPAPAPSSAAQAAKPASVQTQGSSSSAKLWIAVLLVALSGAALWWLGDDRPRASDQPTRPLVHGAPSESPAPPAAPSLPRASADTEAVPSEQESTQQAPEQQAPEQQAPEQQALPAAPATKRTRTVEASPETAPAEAIPAQPAPARRAAPAQDKPIGVADPWE